MYSGKQVFVFCVTSVVVTLVLAFTFRVVGPGASPSGSGDAQNGSSKVPVELASSGSSGVSVASANLSGDYTEDEKNNIAIYQALNEAVVNISTEVVSYGLFFDPVPQKGSTGSGSIIDKKGFILTNGHVVEGATKLYVTLANGDRLEAKLVGRDPENDLAVVQIEPGNRELKTIGFGMSSSLKVGQKVIAIGNPFSFDRTMTVGIVSGLGRPIRNENDIVIQNMIQTDASINPGNSGGPLLDSRGNMIGINTMIYSPSGGSVGVGFAVPVETAKRVLPDLIKYGSVRRGWIDITPIQLFPELVRYARFPVDHGILVSEIQGGGSAAAAGLRSGSKDNAIRYGRTIIYLGGDIITEIDGLATDSIGDLYTALEAKKPGEKVKVVFYRDGRKQTTSVTLVDRPSKWKAD